MLKKYGAMGSPHVQLDPFDVAGLRAFGSSGHGKLNPVSVGKATPAIALNRAVMHKHIRPAVAGNKAEAFTIVEPLNDAAFSY
jgi:hypothetical protein